MLSEILVKAWYFEYVTPATIDKGNLSAFIATAYGNLGLTFALIFERKTFFMILFWFRKDEKHFFTEFAFDVTLAANKYLPSDRKNKENEKLQKKNAKHKKFIQEEREEH